MSSKSKSKLPADLWLIVQSCEELLRYENEGFRKGEAKGKTMNVSLDDLLGSVHKQYDDFLNAYHAYRKKPTSFNASDLKQTIADLRNVSALVFLKLKAIEDSC